MFNQIRTRDGPAVARSFIAAAKKFAARWTTVSSSDLRELLASFLHRIIVSDNRIEFIFSRTKLLSLIKAVARAQVWHDRVLEGTPLDQRSLAREAGLTERYVGEVFACAFLGPDIGEAILDGRQPQDLTFQK